MKTNRVFPPWSEFNGSTKGRKKIYIIMYSSIKTECLSLWILIHNYLKINKEYNKTLLQKKKKKNISSISSKPDTAVFCTGVTLSIQSQHSITKSYTHFHQVSPQGFQVISHTMSLTPYVYASTICTLRFTELLLTARILTKI